MSVLTCVLDNMGSSCSRSHSLSEAETTKNAKIKLLFQTGFDEAELRSYTSVIHANVYQTIKILYEGAKELSQVESDSSKYVISPDNQEIGEKLSDIDGRLDYPLLNKELVLDVKRLWQDPAIQEDVLYARVRTNGVVQIQFSPVGENKRGGEVYRLYDVGGQRNERRKWIHLFEGVNAVIFCAAISEYDQMLFEDETKNRMMETKELFDWVLKQRCFEVPLSVCEWFKDYQPIAPGKQEVEHAYEFVKKKFEELYFQSSKPDRVDRVFKIYRTTALDQKLVKKTFKLIDESMRRSREGT
uniref:Guanine nucleotide-binding protein alpha subunit n=1 Tax=Oryza rufipogon TaxID=4529 RepID=A0A0E0PKW9_ORYRU